VEQGLSNPMKLCLLIAQSHLPVENILYEENVLMCLTEPTIILRPRLMGWAQHSNVLMSRSQRLWDDDNPRTAGLFAVYFRLKPIGCLKLIALKV
jgi:hypothetical protein